MSNTRSVAEKAQSLSLGHRSDRLACGFENQPRDFVRMGDQ
jgi:hypothetical protein